MAAKTGTGFTSLNDYLGANPTAANVGQGLAGDVTNSSTSDQSQANALLARNPYETTTPTQTVMNDDNTGGVTIGGVRQADLTVDPTKDPQYGRIQSNLASDATNARQLGDFSGGGLSNQISNKYGAGSGGALDTAMTQATSGGALKDAASRFGGLDSYLGNANSAAYNQAKADIANHTAVDVNYKPPASTDQVTVGTQEGWDNAHAPAAAAQWVTDTAQHAMGVLPPSSMMRADPANNAPPSAESWTQFIDQLGSYNWANPAGPQAPSTNTPAPMNPSTDPSSPYDPHTGVPKSQTNYDPINYTPGSYYF